MTPRRRKVGGRGRLELAGWRHFVGRVTGQHLINRRGVVEQAVGRVAHRTNQRGLVQMLRHHRHVLADPRAGDSGLDRLEVSANVRRRIGLGIPDVDMRRPALQENHHHALGRLPAARAGVFAGQGGGVGLVAPEEEVRKTQAHHADGADAEQFAPGGSLAVATAMSGKIQHCPFLSRCTETPGC